MKKLIVRYISLGLSILTAVMIFSFSADTGAESGKMSEEITEKVLSSVGINRENTPPKEYLEVKEKTHISIRKLAHFAEYCSLGFFLCVFFLTYSWSRLIAVLSSFGISVVYAILDEWHQSFVPQRGPGAVDVLIDSAGALFGAAVALLALYGCRRVFAKNERKAFIKTKI